MHASNEILSRLDRNIEPDPPPPLQTRQTAPTPIFFVPPPPDRYTLQTWVCGTLRPAVVQWCQDGILCVPSPFIYAVCTCVLALPIFENRQAHMHHTKSMYYTYHSIGYCVHVCGISMDVLSAPSNWSQNGKKKTGTRTCTHACWHTRINR